MVNKRTKSTRVKITPPVPGAPLDITTRDAEGRTPLHLAAFFGYAETVHKMLLQLADVNARDDGERTPGHWPAYKGHLEVMTLLLESGADVNARDTGGRTLLRMAMIGRKPAMEELLRVHGAVL
ncbi:MAG: ankyrin repeat domain-containing protein [Armatimonadota bacterium]